MYYEAFGLQQSKQKLCSKSRDQRVNQIRFSCYSRVIPVPLNRTTFPWSTPSRPAVRVLFQVGVNLHFLIRGVIWGPCSFIYIYILFFCFINKETCRKLWTEWRLGEGARFLGGQLCLPIPACMGVLWPCGKAAGDRGMPGHCLQVCSLASCLLQPPAPALPLCACPSYPFSAPNTIQVLTCGSFLTQELGPGNFLAP